MLDESKQKGEIRDINTEIFWSLTSDVIFKNSKKEIHLIYIKERGFNNG